MNENIDYVAPRKIYTTHPGRTNLMTSDSRLLQLMSVNKVKGEESGFMHLMRPEQKNNARMENNVQKFTKPGNLGVDARAATFFVS